jgi:hypothetical protein
MKKGRSKDVDMTQREKLTWFTKLKVPFESRDNQTLDQGHEEKGDCPDSHPFVQLIDRLRSN